MLFLPRCLSVVVQMQCHVYVCVFIHGFCCIIKFLYIHMMEALLEVA